MPGRFEVHALSAGRNVSLLAEQIREFHPALVSVAQQPAADKLKRLLGGATKTQIEVGDTGLRLVATAGEPDVVVAATVGVAALEAVYAAVQSGARIALANKETLVAAGHLIRAAAQLSGAVILPVDSEHNAIHQCLRAGTPREVRRLILTASGGPFRGWSARQLLSVTPEAALKHPTWSMGQRITIDSATLMNKGFEVIEACHLFGLPQERVDVVVHPQSLVHSLVEFVDGSVLAQLGPADMQFPIQYALTYPQRSPNQRAPLDLAAAGQLTFEAPDLANFPCLRLAREALQAGGAAGAVLNAADEVAVEAFCSGQIPFTAIPAVVEEVLQQSGTLPAGKMEEIIDADQNARQQARAVLSKVPA